MPTLQVDGKKDKSHNKINDVNIIDSNNVRTVDTKKI